MKIEMTNTHQKAEYPPFLECLEGTTSGDSVPLQNFSAQVGNDSMIWKGVTGWNGPPRLLQF